MGRPIYRVTMSLEICAPYQQCSDLATMRHCHWQTGCLGRKWVKCFCVFVGCCPISCGIELWTACDARSSYAWNMQVGTRKWTGGTPERQQDMSIMWHKDTTWPVTTSSYLIGQSCHLLWLQKGRQMSSKFAFTHGTTVVSFMQKKNKNVILRRTLHSSCKRKTLHWPLAIFHNVIDILTYNAFVIWSELNLSWRASKIICRRLERPLWLLLWKATPPSPDNSIRSTGKGRALIWTWPWSITYSTRSQHKGTKEKEMQLVLY